MATEKIEYTTVVSNLGSGLLNTEVLEQELARLGAEGWQLVSVTPIMNQGTTQGLIHHLSRFAEPDRRVGFPVGD